MAKRPRKNNPLEAPKRPPRSVRQRRWRHLADFWFSAANLERERCRAIESTGETKVIDLNFYVVACQRLRNVASAMKVELPKASEALEKFDLRWPQLNHLRDLQEHVLQPNIDPDAGVFGVTYFGEFVANLKPGGKVEYLIGTREHEQALATLHKDIVTILDGADAAERALGGDSP